jgi:hypothetical protein
MQVLDDVELGQAGVSDLAVHQRLRDDPDGLSTRVQHGISEHTHEADTAAAVDQGDPTLGEHITDNAGGISVGRSAAAVRATEDTDHRWNSISGHEQTVSYARVASSKTSMHAQTRAMSRSRNPTTSAVAAWTQRRAACRSCWR